VMVVVVVVIVVIIKDLCLFTDCKVYFLDLTGSIFSLLSLVCTL
jgi:hypothetical protein